MEFVLLHPGASTIVHLTPVDDDGRPVAAVPRPIVWCGPDARVATLDPSYEGLSAEIVAIAPGTAAVNVRAGDLTTSFKVVVVDEHPGIATGLRLSFFPLGLELPPGHA